MTKRALTCGLMAVFALGCGSDDEAASPVQPISDAGTDVLDAEAGPPVDGSPDAQDAAPDATTDADASDGAVPGSIEIPGLSAPVTVRVDGKGVKHLTCATDEDCMAAYGYVLARDNFMVIDLVRRSARGRFAELNTLYLGNDLAQRHFLSTREGMPLEEAIWEKLRDDTKVLVEAQTRGINAWIADLKAGRNDAQLAPEILAAWPTMALDLLPWEALDSVAITASGEQGETGNGLAPDVNNAQTLQVIGPDYFRDLILPLPASDASIVTSQPTMLSSSTKQGGIAKQLMVLGKTRNRLEAYASALDTLAEQQETSRALREIVPFPHASNNWAIGSSMTPHAGSIVESDPHGPLNIPTHMYPIEVDAVSEGTGTLHFLGTGLADMAVYIGRNEHIAWGLTTSLADQIDYYEETLVDNDTAVVFNGQHVPIEYHDISIRRADGTFATASKPWIPHHGPLVSLDLQNHVGISVRWVGHEANADLDAWLDLMRASSAQEALEIARRFEARGNNLVVGDADGHVMWRPLIKMPNRPWAAEHPPYLTLPGDGSAEWDGYLSPDDIPQLYDPSEGYVATANNDFTGAWYDGDPTNDAVPYMQFSCDRGDRAARIREVLTSASTHDDDDVLALQMDDYLWMASRILPELLSLADQGGSSWSTDAQAIRDALEVWQYTCPTGLDGIRPDAPNSSDGGLASESIGCTAYHALVMAVGDRILLDDCASLGIQCGSGAFRDQLIHSILLRPQDMALGDSFWDDLSTTEVEPAEDVVAAAFEDAATMLVALRGSDADGWRWGRVAYLMLDPTIDTGVTYPDQGPFAIGGGMVSINPVIAKPADDGWKHSYGSMLRMVVSFGDSDTADYWQLPGGPGHHPSSPYFLSFMQDYAAGIPYVVPVGTAESEAAAVETLLFIAP